MLEELQRIRLEQSIDIQKVLDSVLKVSEKLSTKFFSTEQQLEYKDCQSFESEIAYQKFLRYDLFKNQHNFSEFPDAYSTSLWLNIAHKANLKKERTPVPNFIRSYFSC